MGNRNDLLEIGKLLSGSVGIDSDGFDVVGAAAALTGERTRTVDVLRDAGILVAKAGALPWSVQELVRKLKVANEKADELFRALSDEVKCRTEEGAEVRSAWAVLYHYGFVDSGSGRDLSAFIREMVHTIEQLRDGQVEGVAHDGMDLTSVTDVLHLSGIPTRVTSREYREVFGRPPGGMDHGMALLTTVDRVEYATRQGVHQDTAEQACRALDVPCPDGAFLNCLVEHVEIMTSMLRKHEKMVQDCRGGAEKGFAKYEYVVDMQGMVDRQHGEALLFRQLLQDAGVLSKDHLPVKGDVLDGLRRLVGVLEDCKEDLEKRQEMIDDQDAALTSARNALRDAGVPESDSQPAVSRHTSC